MSAVVGVVTVVVTVGGVVAVVVGAVGVVVCAFTKASADNDNKKEAKNLLTFSGIFEVSIKLFNRQTATVDS